MCGPVLPAWCARQWQLPDGERGCCSLRAVAVVNAAAALPRWHGSIPGRWLCAGGVASERGSVWSPVQREQRSAGRQKAPSSGSGHAVWGILVVPGVVAAIGFCGVAAKAASGFAFPGGTCSSKRLQRVEDSVCPQHSYSSCFSGHAARSSDLLWRASHSGERSWLVPGQRQQDAGRMQAVPKEQRRQKAGAPAGVQRGVCCPNTHLVESECCSNRSGVERVSALFRCSPWGGKRDPP